MDTRARHVVLTRGRKSREEKKLVLVGPESAALADHWPYSSPAVDIPTDAVALLWWLVDAPPGDHRLGAIIVVEKKRRRRLDHDTSGVQHTTRAYQR